MRARRTGGGRSATKPDLGARAQGITGVAVKTLEGITGTLHLGSGMGPDMSDNGDGANQALVQASPEFGEVMSRASGSASMAKRTKAGSPLSGDLRATAAAQDLIGFARGRRFATLLADPPWRFTNKTGKVAPEHRRLSRYGTMKLDEIMALPVEQLALPTSHLYLWCPNAMLPEGLAVMKAWGFSYKSN